MKQKSSNDFRWYSTKGLAISAIGVLITIAIGVVLTIEKSNEYPDLSYSDSLNNIVRSIEIGRGLSFVTLEDDKKYTLDRSLNREYDADLSTLISIGDLIVKKPFSDTIRVHHLEKEYIYVLGETIGK